MAEGKENPASVFKEITVGVGEKNTKIKNTRYKAEYILCPKND